MRMWLNALVQGCPCHLVLDLSFTVLPYGKGILIMSPMFCLLCLSVSLRSYFARLTVLPVIDGSHFVLSRYVEFVVGNKIPSVFVLMDEREVVTSNDKPRIVAHRYIIEASIEVS
jgi:hypothetical protein